MTSIMSFIMFNSIVDINSNLKYANHTLGKELFVPLNFLKESSIF